MFDTSGKSLEETYAQHGLIKFPEGNSAYGTYRGKSSAYGKNQENCSAYVVHQNDHSSFEER